MYKQRVGVKRTRLTNRLVIISPSLEEASFFKGGTASQAKRPRPGFGAICNVCVCVRVCARVLIRLRPFLARLGASYRLREKHVKGAVGLVRVLL